MLFCGRPAVADSGIGSHGDGGQGNGYICMNIFYMWWYSVLPMTGGLQRQALEQLARARLTSNKSSRRETNLRIGLNQTQYATSCFSYSVWVREVAGSEETQMCFRVRPAESGDSGVSQGRPALRKILGWWFAFLSSRLFNWAGWEGGWTNCTHQHQSVEPANLGQPHSIQYCNENYVDIRIQTYVIQVHRNIWIYKFFIQNVD